MILGIYSIRDVKADAYMTPYFSQNDLTAERSFQHSANHADSIIATNPGDYSLYKLGEFDDTSGDVQAVNPPKFIANPNLKK